MNQYSKKDFTTSMDMGERGVFSHIASTVNDTGDSISKMLRVVQDNTQQIARRSRSMFEGIHSIVLESQVQQEKVYQIKKIGGNLAHYFEHTKQAKGEADDLIQESSKLINALSQRIYHMLQMAKAIEEVVLSFFACIDSGFASLKTADVSARNQRVPDMLINVGESNELRNLTNQGMVQPDNLQRVVIELNLLYAF